MTEPAFEDLTRELQAARPQATEELRERVLTIARSEPVQERRRFRIAPFVLPALGTATVVAFVAVGVTALQGTRGGDGSEEAAATQPAADSSAQNYGAPFQG